MEVTSVGINDGFAEWMGRFRFSAPLEEKTRNGNVLSFDEPCMWTMVDPLQRVLTNPVRQANPFFHVAEVVWMLAGANDVAWLAQFNKRFWEYAEPDTDEAHGAYGHRWMYQFGFNQIPEVAGMLSSDKKTRRAVLTMWDPRQDLGANKNDLPCNTHIYFRVMNEKLSMTVCNRSNDVIWGMLGANVVHMTYLHELIAKMAGVGIGRYHVMTNNLHMYEWLPNFMRLRDQWNWEAEEPVWCNVPILRNDERYEMLRGDCKRILMNFPPHETHWARNVAWPMVQSYLARKQGDRQNELMYREMVADRAWHRAAELWEEWKNV